MSAAQAPAGRVHAVPAGAGRCTGILLAGALLLAGAAAGGGSAGAEGALAVGLPGDVGRQGLAVGWAVNHGTKAAAQAEALRRCREAREPPQATRELCKVVETFDDACVALALDPDAGTPGRGWAVAETREAAEAAAMEDCRRSSDEKRRAACRVTLVRCDGQ
jgi:uncharacterized protein DUF4189